MRSEIGEQNMQKDCNFLAFFENENVDFPEEYSHLMPSPPQSVQTWRRRMEGKWKKAL